jgi:hypothetical protein
MRLSVGGFSFRLFSLPVAHRIILHMALRGHVPDTFSLTGDPENRVLETLRVAQHQVRLAQGGAAPRMQDALAALEVALSDQIAWLENAAEDDRTDAEESGEAERERRAYYPLKAA